MLKENTLIRENKSLKCITFLEKSCSFCYKKITIEKKSFQYAESNNMNMKYFQE